MTLGTILLDLKNLIGPGIEVDDTGLKRWLNDAYYQVIGEINNAIPDFFTKTTTASTVAGQQEYSLPSDFEKMVMVNAQYSGTWRRLLPMSNINYIPVHESTSSNQGFSESNPQYYISGSYYGLMPIPTSSTSSAIKLWYVYTPAELSDADEPDFPASYHHLLKYGAYALYLDQDDEAARAERIRQRFDGMIQRMVENLATRQVDEPKSVEITSNHDLYSDNNIYI